jgi:hypothetical protein
MDYHTISNNPDHRWQMKQEISQSSPLAQEERLIRQIRDIMTPFYSRKIQIYSNVMLCPDRFNDRSTAVSTIPPALLHQQTHFIPRIETWNNMTEYAFVLSPFGNGMDCHRTWEALLCGCIPIVRGPVFSELFDGLPVLIVDKWEDVTSQLLKQTVYEFKLKHQQNAFQYERLHLSYYTKWWNKNQKEINKDYYNTLYVTSAMSTPAIYTTSIAYMWNFKPNERAGVPMNCIQQNKQFVPDHTIVTPADVTPILSSFPGLPELWAKIPQQHWVVKADLGRLLYIYKHGGCYLDVDCVIVKNPFHQASSGINPKNDRLILFTEFTVTIDALGPRECKNPRNSLRIANYAFAANYKRHPFLELCIRECMRRLEVLFQSNLDKWAETDILWVCGPDVITTIYHAQFGADGTGCGADADVDTSVRLMDRGWLRHLGYGSWRD